MLVRRELPMFRRLPSFPAFDELMPEVELRFVPTFDVKETKESYVFKADVPGMAEKDIDVSIAGHCLTVSGTREQEKKDEGDVFYTWERSYGAFTRSFTLPDEVDPEHVEAEMKNGVLTIVAAKRPELKPHRISIKGLIEKVTGGKEEMKA